jgi:RimJ/RimL family protein N-acetyltransferase
MDVSLLDFAIKQSLDHLLPWIFWAKQEPVSFEERIEFLRRTRGNFDLGTDYGYLVFNSAETLVIGGTGLSTRLGQGAREIGYWIHKDHINQGYATEVSAALIKVAFVVDHVRRVEIHCSPKNTRSASVPRKLGFIHEATLHNRAEDVDGNLRDTMVWTLFEENYPTSLAAKIDLQAFDAIGRRII